MNKKQISYLLLGIGLTVSLCITTGILPIWKKSTNESIEKIDKEKITPLQEQTLSSEDKDKSSTPEPSEEIKKETKKEDKEENKKDEKQNDSKEATEKLNAKTGKVIVNFKNGDTVTESEINDELNKLPEQLSAKMSLKDIKFFLGLKLAFDHVLLEAAKKEGIDNDKEVLSEIEQKSGTIAGMMLLNEKASKLMTDKALQEQYDKIWDENFKGTKEISVKVITTNDETLAKKIKKMATSEESLNKIIETNKNKLKAIDLDNRPESSLPEQLTNELKENNNAVNTIVGPIAVKETFMLFFIKKVAPAQKHELSGKFKEEFKKISMKDFIAKVNENQYKEYKVRFIDSNGKEIDIKKQSEQTKNRANEKEKPTSQFDLKDLKDTTVLGYIGDEKVTANDIKTYFKLQSLQDDALIMMAQQFNMTLNEILIYATKLVIDDKILAKAAKEEKYYMNPEVKEKLDDVKKLAITNAYLKKHVNVTSEDIRKTFNDVLKSIPEEDKNDHEISTKMLFFATKEEAENTLKSINSGKVKFNEMFKTKENSDKSALNLGYMTKKGSDPAIWSIIKRSSSATCHKEIIELNGENFGMNDLNYAVLYVGDRRPITLPSLSNPNDKKYFEAIALQKASVDFVSNLFTNSINSMFDKNITEIEKDPSFKKMLEAMVAGSR